MTSTDEFRTDVTLEQAEAVCNYESWGQARRLALRFFEIAVQQGASISVVTEAAKILEHAAIHNTISIESEAKARPFVFPGIPLTLRECCSIRDSAASPPDEASASPGGNS